MESTLAGAEEIALKFKVAAVVRVGGSFGWAGLSLAPVGDTHLGGAVGTYVGVAVGTYVYLLAAMSFGQALTLPSFSALGGQECHLLRRGIRTLA